VVGGGIAGLSAAWELRGEAEITVFEPDQVGGCVRTTPFLGRAVEEGPDAFITRVPDGLALARELGLEGDLIAPAAGRTALWWDGRLRTLPEGLVLGVPGRIGSLVRTGILSPAGVARAALDLVLPRRGSATDATVRQLVAGRFGSQVADRLVDPLVGSIHAGSTAALGAAETVPQLQAAAQSHRSLLLGLRSGQPAGPGSSGPLFMTHRQGLSHLVDELVRQLKDSGTRFAAQEVVSVRRMADGRYGIEPDVDGFDAVVVATPAGVTSRLLGPEVFGPLAGLPTASVAVITVASADLRLPPELNGFLVPAGSRRLMTACSFASNKWPHWADPGTSVVRISVGRSGQEEALRLPDSALVDRLVDELQDALGRRFTPSAWRVSRWPNAFPQYLPGHADRVATVEAGLARLLPGVAVAGSSYRGAGLPACIASGRRAARAAKSAVLRAGVQPSPSRSAMPSRSTTAGKVSPRNSPDVGP
jgi:protoporphyrinogen/coproporphyrinogen III oxidase